MISGKKSVNIPKGSSGAVSRGSEYTQATIKRTKGQAMMYKTLHRKLKNPIKNLGFIQVLRFGRQFLLKKISSGTQMYVYTRRDGGIIQLN